MNRKVKIGSGIITLTDRHYLAGGGEGDVFVNGNKAFKIYHDKSKSLPIQKIKELGLINQPNVVVPQEIIYDVQNGDVIGYVTDFINNTDPLLKYFTRTFKNDHNIDNTMILSLLKQMHHITQYIHSCNILVVDYNELNILVKNSNGLIPYYIDTDSYQTPSFKSSAVMNSIMDRRCSKTVNGHLVYNADEFSDWFSWGVLSFWILINIHPFRSNHPQYKPAQKMKQMDDNVSVFDPKSKLPPSVNPFNIIPKHLLDWYKFIFADTNNRSIPPLPDSMAPITVPTQIITIQGTDKLTVVEVATYSSNVLYVIQHMGINYAVTKTHICADKKEMIGWDKAQKVLLCPAPDGTIISATLKGTIVSFADIKSGVPFGTIQSKDVFQRNNAFYTMSAGKLIENTFTTFGNKTIHKVAELENVSQLTSTMYNGCIIQDLLGKKFITIPFKQGACFSKYIPNLDGFRVVDAKCDKNVAVVVAEKSGKYHRFIIVFDKNYQSFEIRETADISYDEINFAVLNNGFCILLSSPTELELFVKANQYETLPDPPLDANMELFTTQDGFFFLNGNSIYQLKRK